MTTRNTKNKTKNGGTVLVEAAVTFLTLFIMLFGIVEGGRLFNMQQTLTNAAREAARQAVTPLTQTDTMLTDPEVVVVATTFLSAANIPCSGCVSVLRNTTTPCVGCAAINVAHVTVTVPYQLITLSMFLNTTLTMHGRAVMREETSAN